MLNSWMKKFDIRWSREISSQIKTLEVERKNFSFELNKILLKLKHFILQFEIQIAFLF